jgi:protein-disulfide isomerase
LSLKIVTSTQIAIEAGVRYDPTLFIDGKPFIEGLVDAQEITTLFKKLQ